jgi:hypothetical protein
MISQSSGPTDGELVCQSGKTRKALPTSDLRLRKRRDIFRGVMKRVPFGEDILSCDGVVDTGDLAD